MNRSLAGLAGFVFLLAACAAPSGTPGEESDGAKAASSPAGGKSPELKVTSSAFDDGQPVPERYSCHGQNVSPPLAWTGVPSGAAELALVVDDPDAPGRTYIHWVVVGIDPSATGVGTGRTPTGGTVLANSGGDRSYLGPCPPSGLHHYRFTVYTLDQPLRLETGTKAADAVAAIDKAASAWGRLTGTYRG